MSRPLPRHVAIIMDGNGRWATARGLPRVAGHREGAASVREVVTAAREMGLEALTLYSFSTENWKRPATEVAALMSLLKEYLLQERETLLERSIRLNVLGQVSRLPSSVQGLLEDVCRASSKGAPAMTLNLALSYGGRAEIVAAAQKVARAARDGRLRPEQVTEDLLSSYMGTRGQPDPDLLIRTSGEMRLSNFLLWQIAYSEIYITDVLWPDFRKPDLQRAVSWYQTRERRFGGISKEG